MTDPDFRVYLRRSIGVYWADGSAAVQRSRSDPPYLSCTTKNEFLFVICSSDIELRAFSRGFLSGELGFITSFSPTRRYADTPIRSPSVVAAMLRCDLSF